MMTVTLIDDDLNLIGGIDMNQKELTKTFMRISN